jgi:hypothetical protein
MRLRKTLKDCIVFVFEVVVMVGRRVDVRADGGEFTHNRVTSYISR